MEEGPAKQAIVNFMGVTTNEASLDYIPPVQYIVFGQSCCTAWAAFVHTTRRPMRKSSIMISTDIPPGAAKQISVGERQPPQPPRFRSETPD